MDRPLIIGGAGFIGTNLADHRLSAGAHVTILDSFRRPGTRDNAAWLRSRHGNRLTIVEGDVRDRRGPLRRLVTDADVVVHLAAQVAVTTSVRDPREDFEINALGTFNVLEAVRHAPRPPVVLYSSTNKVYGKLDDLATVERDGRHAYRDLPLGVPETRSLDFHSPYGCSKGAADQYVLDYHRIYGLPTVVLRQSCIYGPHQFGISDQGWVAWFAIQALRRRPIVVYGDGTQVRDVLYVGDLVAAYEAAVVGIATTAGNAYNVGGGPSNTLSLLELLQLLAARVGHVPAHTFEEARPGDQLVFVSDVRKAARDFGWRPVTPVAEGLGRLIAWLRENEHVLTLDQRPAAAPGIGSALATH
ncbi:MAG TPA: NAD-dependent epimerase/dehydratase family protein [Gemmatimonadaceae bacterium]|nr:NAD-dependent epimerase/dehydratase family protein [Gemmatimonadaceae bacterium]